uniref:Peptidase M16 C-terminal domain-containing protein n=1 Tax=Aegilops tauschii subsp. strangulata TaxID=200361 RepID=A0A453EXA6_AEGTS
RERDMLDRHPNMKVVFTGFAYGGLSELSEDEYTSCTMGSTIAGEIGIFGYRPSVLMDMLAGKRAEVGTKVGAYIRSFSGDCSPSDLETGLQLVYQLFTTKVEPREEEVKIVMQMAEEAIYAQERDPYTAFANRSREINYGNSYFFKPIRISDLKKVNPIRACEYFNSCFKDPSAFTVVVVGNIDPAISIPLILEYLGGIPKVQDTVQPLSREDLKGLPFKFPETIIREVVRSPMVEAQCFVQLGFPVVLKSTMMTEDIHYVGFLSKLLETKIMQVLRFKYGQVYSVNVGVFLGGNKPSRSGDVRGDISVNFSCDPDMSSRLVDFVLEEISYLQTEGPSEEDVWTILEIEQRAHENGLQENYYWLDRILRSYQSRIYSGNVGSTFMVQDEGRVKVREALTPQAMQMALRRVISFPCKKQFTVVILMPKSSRWNSLISVVSWSSGGFSRDAKILAGMAGALVLAASLWRYSRGALRS